MTKPAAAPQAQAAQAHRYEAALRPLLRKFEDEQGGGNRLGPFAFPDVPPAGSEA